jgi:hypothetical protein
MVLGVRSFLGHNLSYLQWAHLTAFSVNNAVLLSFFRSRSKNSLGPRFAGGASLSSPVLGERSEQIRGVVLAM